MTVYSEFLKREDCLLLIVDMQKVMVDLCDEADTCRKHIGALIELANIFGIPVVFSEHNRDKLGGALPDLLEAAPGAPVINKLEFSCFQNEDLHRAMAVLQRKSLILCGIEAHVCIFHTGAGALNSGYRVHVVADAVSSRNRNNKQIGLRRLEQAGAVISSTEMVIFELLNRAGTAEFRRALPLIKHL